MSTPYPSPTTCGVRGDAVTVTLGVLLLMIGCGGESTEGMFTGWVSGGSKFNISTLTSLCGVVVARSDLMSGDDGIPTCFVLTGVFSFRRFLEPCSFGGSGAAGGVEEVPAAAEREDGAILVMVEGSAVVVELVAAAVLVRGGTAMFAMVGSVVSVPPVAQCAAVLALVADTALVVGSSAVLEAGWLVPPSPASNATPLREIF